MSDADAVLVARVIAADDRAAFELLVRRHQSPLRNFLRKLTRGDAARADDLAQEAFIKAYAALPGFRGAAKFSSWLYRIAYTTFLNDNRRRRADETEFDDAQHSAAVTRDDAGAADDATDLERALRRLPVRHQAVFDLHYGKGMTHDEVAETLELPLGTVKSDLARGQERLREYLKDWEAT